MIERSLDEARTSEISLVLGVQLATWFMGVQAATFAALGNLDVSNLGLGLVAIPLWGPPWHFLVTWVIFRSRFRRFSTKVPWLRLFASFACFAASGFGIIKAAESRWLNDTCAFFFNSHLIRAISPSFGFFGDSAGIVALELLWAIIGVLITGGIFFFRKVRLVLIALTGAAAGLLVCAIAIEKAYVVASDWRASPSMDEYAVYTAIAEWEFSQHGIVVQAIRNCNLQFSHPSADALRAVGGYDAFLSHTKRQMKGCRIQRPFDADSKLRIFDGAAASPEELQSYAIKHPEPMSLDVFSRVGFSPDGDRAYVSRISIRQRYTRESGRELTVARIGTTLTMVGGQWKVDFGTRFGEWEAVQAKGTDHERKARATEIRKIRGLHETSTN